MTKYLLPMLLVIFAFLAVGCQEKIQPSEQTTQPMQTVESVPTIPEKPTEPVIETLPTEPTEPIVGTTPTAETEQVEALSFINKEGILKVKEGGKVCLLADDAIDYETFISPDATMIAVETLLMSNLQIVRVYKKEIDGCFHPPKNALSTKLWHDLSEKEGFSMDDVDHSRMKFLKWIDNNQVLIGLSGEIGIKVIDTNTSCDLELLF